MPPSPTHRPDPRYSRLPDALYDVVAPARFPRGSLRFRNQRAAARVGLDTLDEAEWQRHFWAFEPLPGNLPTPLALRYHGHQFQHYNPRLGDGRGFLFAQLRDDQGRLLDLGTKGSGATPWSRGGDGRLTLKGGVREVLATELLEALGVNTSKSFSLFETGEPLYRNDEPSPTRSSVLVRLSHSHVRIGTFQRLAWQQDRATMSALLDHAATQLIPEVEAAPDRREAFFRAVVRRVADTTAAWMVAGFVHGVLNTDNINITGESFDYGPWRFLERYDPSFTAAYFDEGGLYAYGRQPEAVLWDLTELARALTLLGPAEPLREALATFEPLFAEAYRKRFLWRLGVVADDGVAADLIGELLTFLEAAPLSYAQLFFDWRGGPLSNARALRSPEAALYRRSDFLPAWSLLQTTRPLHPHLLDRALWTAARPPVLPWRAVETLWDPIADADDWRAFEATVADLRRLGEAMAAGGPPPTL